MNQDKIIKAITQKYWYNINTGRFLRKRAFRDKLAGSVACGVHQESGYRYISVKIEGKQKNIRAHRAAFLLSHGYLPEIVDHINNDKQDNRIDNLREATHEENSYNVKGHFTTRGVKKEANGTFTTFICKKPHRYNLGNYATEAEAATAYNIGARQMHGEFATLNSIDEVAGVTVDPRKVGSGVGKRIAMHDEIVALIKKKTKLCRFTGDVLKKPHGHALKCKSTIKRWRQKYGPRKNIFKTKSQVCFNEVYLNKEDVVHVHQYGKLPIKKSKTKRDKLDLSRASHRARLKKNRLGGIDYNPSTGKFTRGGKEIKSIPCKQGYTYISVGRMRVLAHRLAYLIIHDDWPEVVDHINNDRKDNRIKNLRAATRSQNNNNRKPRKNSSSKYKGLSWTKQKNKWQVKCQRKHLGYFNCEEEAAEAYNREAKKLHGEFAYINKI